MAHHLSRDNNGSQIHIKGIDVRCTLMHGIRAKLISGEFQGML